MILPPLGMMRGSIERTNKRKLAPWFLYIAYRTLFESWRTLPNRSCNIRQRFNSRVLSEVATERFLRTPVCLSRIHWRCHWNLSSLTWEGGQGDTSFVRGNSSVSCHTLSAFAIRPCFSYCVTWRLVQLGIAREYGVCLVFLFTDRAVFLRIVVDWTTRWLTCHPRSMLKLTATSSPSRTIGNFGRRSRYEVQMTKIRGANLQTFDAALAEL